MDTLRDARQYRAKGRPTLELDQGRVLAAEEDRALLASLGLDTVAGAMAFEGGEVVRDAGPRRTYRVATEHGVLFVKVHRDVPWPRRMAFFGRRSASPARCEWDAIGMLRHTGFDVPEPVAVGESSAVVGCPRQSYLVTREVQGPALDELLADGYPNPRSQSERDARDQVIRDVSGLVRRFHHSGFYHKDLYLCHFIVTDDPRWGRPYLIDLERVERAYPPRRRWLVKDLAALQHSAPSTVTRTDRLRFLLNYLCKQRLDPQAKRCARDVLAKARGIAEHVPRYG